MHVGFLGQLHMRASMSSVRTLSRNRRENRYIHLAYQEAAQAAVSVKLKARYQYALRIIFSSHDMVFSEQLYTLWEFLKQHKSLQPLNLGEVSEAYFLFCNSKEREIFKKHNLSSWYVFSIRKLRNVLAQKHQTTMYYYLICIWAVAVPVVILYRCLIALLNLCKTIY